jgi:putative transcriptional regulator
MSKTGQRLIEAAKEAASIARGERKAARLHIPAEIDVRLVRQKFKLSQEDFASEFGFSVTQIRDWEQGRSRPIGGVRAYIMLIDQDGEVIRRLLNEAKARAGAGRAAA